MSNFILFHVNIQLFPAPFAEMTILSHRMVLPPLLKIIRPHMQVYFLALYVITLAYVSVFMPVPHCFDYFSFVESFEISNYETSNFLLFQDCFWLFGVHWILR